MSADGTTTTELGLAPRPPLQPPADEPLLQAPPNGVVVRMYRQGLGDCFLLAFPTADPTKSYYMLVDCGVLQGAPNSAANCRAVARSIQLATGGNIHLLVVTHRHGDHIAGFQYANTIFSQMAIHNLWLGWPEKPDDPLAQSLWKQSNQALAALRRAIDAQPQALARVQSVLDFVGNLAAAGDDPLATARALLKPGSTPDYRRPGDGPMALPPVSGYPQASSVRLYVLGPPVSLQRLGQMDPAAGKHETYLTSSRLSAMTGFIFGGIDPRSLSGDDRQASEQSLPFAEYLRMPGDEAARSDFFRANYGFDGPAADSLAWRRIDSEWLGTAEDLALQLDNCINNTSLALAIELVASGKVLLFPADAQVGNWQSWHDLPAWTLPGGQTVSAADLQARTVLYKVGHHGSHNATAAALADDKPWGLELMASPDLVAMLPVDEEFANQVKKWPMPWQNLMNRLNPRTRQRIMRLDTGIPAASPGDLSPSAWEAFKGQVTVTDLYVQYMMS